MILDQALVAYHAQQAECRGVFHIGANRCQELDFYVNRLGVPAEKVVWVEAIPSMVEQMKEKGVLNMFQAVLDETAGTVLFSITRNDGQSSSILPLADHLKHYPDITVSRILTLQAETVPQFLERAKVPEECLDFWNLDIQGAELRVLRGAGELLRKAKIIYTEVNTQELYKGCAMASEIDEYLESYGFHCIAKNILPQGWGDALYVRKA